MKKTLLITLDYPPLIGGVANYYKNLLSCLPPDKIIVLDDAQHQLLALDKFIWPKWLQGLWSTFKLVRKEKIEHILVGQILPIGTIALVLKLLLGIPYTVMTHAMDVTLPFGEEGMPRKRWLIKNILRYAQHITTVSVYTRLHLEELGVSPQNISMIYPCPHICHDGRQNLDQEIALIEQKHQLSAKRILLSVCRLVERKGIDMVIYTMRELREKYPNLIYCIVGDGPDRVRLENIVQQEGLKNSVLFTGRVSDQELHAWYQRSEIFVMPARQLSNNDVEGFGIVFLEANSFGKPVIAGKSGGISDAVVDGKTGFLVDPTDILMLTKALDRLLSDKEKALALGRFGKERVEEFFQWKIQAKELEKILQ
ncbi:MAG: hypothetical protein A2233_00360 [Candidatus Kerfeldbacteria bacterium RIFOXYA2_FULL_38_24]|uniref:Glycosyl transferase family 1 domain-containing protein n=1 Tax=Candidatus Kerfeldbacteria bacterium RIFOXYB2_FULL_38_14 TaxID=1798547 RepID=A0A1G2BA09_9BACT|nr:MAG: hypothetical protein A2233_00360 [Candidatus Kerfeldbacteria bacterium RIFOXYA2_FULL_38_24]OGY86048.1 MAG: hypothetical protein A2319_00565 [Candidatus Kerfeldbacteria bacterium RIFOXYB2_FULL_38_14]OGY90164.1 MAG: hypothetical protein A2458_04820 [Candidatus Kerfeldbacteria bacterium RIFOXYC2_FULL_38_9]